MGDDLLDRVVITSGGYAYRRKDGVAVAPAASLAPESVGKEQQIRSDRTGAYPSSTGGVISTTGTETSATETLAITSPPG